MSGYLLLLYVIMQFRLGIKRLLKKTTDLKPTIQTHKPYGLFAPLPFYTHSMEIGYACQTLLAIAFLGDFMVGYLNPRAITLRNKSDLIGWTVIHVNLAILTLALLLLHTFVVFNYS